VVTDDVGTDIRVPAGRLRTLLAVLLLRANQPVPLDEIVDVLWDGVPPAAAARTVRVYVTRLRQVLGPNAGTRVVTCSRGYLCQVDEDELDLLRLETLCREARSASRERCWSRAIDLLTEALGQWRGAPLADIPSELLRAKECPRLNHLRQQAIEDTIDARMNLRQHQQLIPQLRELTDDQPLREHLHAQLMRALARSGRRAEALDAYRRAHRTLADQLGIQPGPELRELHQRILAGDEEQPHAGDPASSSWPVRTSGQAPVGAGQVARRTTWSGFVVPRQLPAATGHFTGRQAELDTLVDLLASADRAEETVVISAIDGMAGVGKTALAVHWAQLHAAAFPDGQLYIDLRGYTHG
jgi:DNA-binding SARP family transcriptional activator